MRSRPEHPSFPWRCDFGNVRRSVGSVFAGNRIRIWVLPHQCKRGGVFQIKDGWRGPTTWYRRRNCHRTISKNAHFRKRVDDLDHVHVHCPGWFGGEQEHVLLSSSSPIVFATRQLRRRRTASALRTGHKTASGFSQRGDAGASSGLTTAVEVFITPVSSEALTMRFIARPRQERRNALPVRAAIRPRSPSHARRSEAKVVATTNTLCGTPKAFLDLGPRRWPLRTGRRSARTPIWYTVTDHALNAVWTHIGPKFGVIGLTDARCMSILNHPSGSGDPPARRCTKDDDSGNRVGTWAGSRP